MAENKVMAGKKLTLGRQKIKIEKLKKDRDIYATFSKRRSGIFKKASELCILCDVDIAIIIFSPTGKPHAFVHPSIESAMRRFGVPYPTTSGTGTAFEDGRRARAIQLSQQRIALNELIAAEHVRAKALHQTNQLRTEKYWWEAPIEEMNKEQLEQLLGMYQHIYVQTNNRIQELQGQVP